MIKNIVIANIPIHLLTMNSLHEIVRETIYSGKKRLFLHANARLIELANTNEVWLQEFCSNQVDYVMCDGSGIQLAARITRQPVPKKIAYNIWIWIFVKFLREHDFSIFLLGADKLTISNAKAQLENFAAGLKIVGIHDGFFDRKSDSQENLALLGEINSAKPDVLLVGFGMPIQEIWIRDNYEKIDVRCIFSCGGAFDFISGNRKVAPKVFRKLYLEWFFRFMQEPSRLFDRVTTSFVKFGKHIMKQRLKQTKKKNSDDEEMVA